MKVEVEKRKKEKKKDALLAAAVFFPFFSDPSLVCSATKLKTLPSNSDSPSPLPRAFAFLFQLSRMAIALARAPALVSRNGEYRKGTRRLARGRETIEDEFLFFSLISFFSAAFACCSSQALACFFSFSSPFSFSLTLPFPGRLPNSPLNNQKNSRAQGLRPCRSPRVRPRRR